MAASKQGSAAKIPYFESLDSASKVRYLAKLKVIGNLDPYTMSADRFSADPTYLPSVNYANIYTYLVNTPSPYTKDELECYKGLDAYNQFVSGWVRDVKATVVENMHDLTLNSYQAMLRLHLCVSPVVHARHVSGPRSFGEQ